MRVLGVLAGTDMPMDQLGAWVRSADIVFAADGGANALLQLGIEPDLTIGDLDSISNEALDRFQAICDSDQSTSDCDKLLTAAGAAGHLSITLVNVEGDLPDHFLASVHSALKSGLDVRLALRRGLGYVLGPGGRQVRAPEGARVSMIPLEECRGVSLQGVHWPLDDVDLSPRGSTSLSNVAVRSVIDVRLDAGAAFLTTMHPVLESPCWPESS